MPRRHASLEAQQQAQAEGLTLLVSDNTTGYLGVNHQPGRPKPYQAQLKRRGKMLHLGSFVTAGEAALCVARSPEGQAAAAQAAAAPVPLTSEEARQQAQAEGLTLRVSANKAGYVFGVSRAYYQYDHPKPYQARVYNGGSFATAEEAALCVARWRRKQGQEDREEEQEKEQEESFHFAGSKSFI